MVRAWATVLALSLLALGQAGGGAKPRVAGMTMASAFGRWSAQGDGAAGAIKGDGSQETVRLASGTFTLPDGAAFLPLQAGTAVAIGGDGNPETVTPTAVSCGMGSGSCTFTAAFSRPHAGHFTVTSATHGLQEAIDYTAAQGGGVVLADPQLGAPVASLLPLVKLPANVLMVDETAGDWTFYGLGNGGEPQAIGSFSSLSGASLPANLNATMASLNGAQFAGLHNFMAVAPGGSLSAGVAATITPGWALPSGVVAGDTLYIAGGMGVAEVVTATNVGTACPGGATSSVCFTPAHAHTGAWTLASATAGLQEAVNAAGAGGWVIDDEPTAAMHTALVLSQTVRLSGFSDMDAATGTTIEQLTPNTDVIQVGTPSLAPSDVVIENLMAVGVAGDGSDGGVAIHCLNCAKLKLSNVTGKQAHDGLYFDSTYGHAFDAAVTGSHFIGNYYGVHIVGGSANRLTFTGNTMDGNVYGVFDDGGWVHTWMGNDFESNSKYGYWQQDSDPAQYSGHGVDFYGNYFEANGADTAGQGDLFLGQLVNGGTGNNGDGCDNCVISGNLFNASSGGQVTALSLGAVNGTVSANTYSGYASGKTYAYITGPAPNYTRVISLGDGGGDSGATANSGAYGGARAGALTRIDDNGGLVLGGWDQLNDQFGSPLLDTTLESPTGIVSLRGKPGGLMASNGAQLALDSDSSAVQGGSISFRNQHATGWQISSDPFAANAHDFCMLFDYASSQCVAYVSPQDKFLFGAAGPTGSLGSRTQDFQIKQDASGDSALVINRFSDASPSGYLLDLEDATLSTPLFRIDTSGTVTAGNWNNSNSTMTVGPLTATSGTFSGGVSAASYGAVNATTGTFSGAVNGTNATLSGELDANGGIKINGAVVNAAPGAQSGTLFASSSFSAGQCLSGGVSFSSGVSVGMAVATNPETAPPSGLTWNAMIDGANHVTIRVCNVTAGTIPWSTGAVWDVRVIP